MNRRDFLKKGLSAGGALFLAPSFVFSQGRTPRSIVIIGAGLSGLVAGYELAKRGHGITILEAQERVGGRILTVREPFAENLYADAGASRIPHDHELTLKYVAKFNLPLVPFYPRKGKFVRLKNGRPQQVGWGKFADQTDAVMHLEKPELWSKIRGGMDRLPKALAERLKEKIKLACRVEKISPGADSVEISFAENGIRRKMSADFLVCAIPFTMLRRIEIVPDFSAAKRQVIESLDYGSAARVFLQMHERFWERSGLNGFAVGADNVEIWDVSFQQNTTRGLLQTYLRGEASEKLAALPGSERLAAALEKVEPLFPGSRRNFETGVAKCWSEDPFVFGAWAHAGSTKTAEIIKKPENRVFFAGEHASGFASWMQGALESGLRAAEEIEQAVKA